MSRAADTTVDVITLMMDVLITIYSIDGMQIALTETGETAQSSLS